MQRKWSAQAGSSSISSSLIPLVAGEPRARFPRCPRRRASRRNRHAAVPYNVGGGGEGRCPQSRFRSQLGRSCPRRAVPPRNGKGGVFVLLCAIFGILVRSCVIEVLFTKDRSKKVLVEVEVGNCSREATNHISWSCVFASTA